MQHHTPSPWTSIVPPSSCQTHRFIEAQRTDGPNITIAEVGSQYCDRSVSISQAAANARLMASAPDMLATLEKISDMLASHSESKQGNSKVHYLMHMARSAIAKATAKA